ncbi:unnamed protein product [Anisakis simplex]|uniref:Cytochrome c (inferred by orthology to a human protein) n=1 Tax=Anisakis simplex TaxID=6269 RepID=A0A0M3K4D9_ANISI|nr:unnamed protein product [Anisakis simplex]
MKRDHEKGNRKTDDDGHIPEGDYENGKRIFKYRCQQCHAIDSTKCTKAGPGLNGIFSRISGTLPNYVYSPSMKNKVSRFHTILFHRCLLSNPIDNLFLNNMSISSIS